MKEQKKEKNERSFINLSLLKDGQLKQTLDIHLPPITLEGMLYENGVSLMGDIIIGSIENPEGPTYYGYTQEDGVFNFRLPDGNYELTNVEMYTEESMEIIDFNKPFTIESGKVIINGKQADRLDFHLEDGTRQSVE